jgi:hypothetical protein
MSTSGTSAFNLDLNNLVEEAFERCGKELRSGYDLRTARRSLNLITIEWANRGINLWTVEQGTIPMVTGQAIYPVPSDTIDLLDHVIRQNNGTTNQTDINISRIAEPTYSSIPNKLTQGRPIQVYFNRQSGRENLTAITLAQSINATDTTITLSSVAGIPAAGFVQIGSETISYPGVDATTNQLLNCARGQNGTTAAGHGVIGTPPITVQNLPCINVWPTPNPPGDQYLFVYWRMRRIQDAGVGGTYEQDIPFRLLTCLVAALAYYLSIKLPGVDATRIQMLKADYEEQWTLASAEDRDTSPLRIVPRNLFYYG